MDKWMKMKKTQKCDTMGKKVKKKKRPFLFFATDGWFRLSILVANSLSRHHSLATSFSPL